MINKNLTTVQKAEKIIELFKQISKVGFGSTSLMVHGVPVLELNKKWEVTREFSSNGDHTYFTAHLVNKNDSALPDPNIILFGDMPSGIKELK